METKSIWSDISIPGDKPSSGSYDVIVIGAGIMGITAAYLLAHNGKRVCLVDRARIGGVDSSYTTAHLTYVTDTRLHTLVKNFGKDNARLAWSAGKEAIDLIEKIIQRENIQCDFRRVDGYLHHPFIPDSEYKDYKLEEDLALASELDFDAEFVEAVPYFGLPGIKFKNQALFHPMKYMAGLVESIKQGGGDVFEYTEITEFEKEEMVVRAGGYVFEGDYFVIATHVPLVGRSGYLPATFFQTKQLPYSTYAVGARVGKSILPEASFWDLSSPYYYLRVERGEEYDYAILGGADHKTGQAQDTEAAFCEIEDLLLTLVPGAKLDRRWSGKVIETSDGLPYIGETAKNQFAATGFGGNGMTFGTVAAQMALDAVYGIKAEYNELFSPSRFKLMGAAVDYIKENLDYPYHFIRDRIGIPKEDYEVEIAPGEGRVVEINGEKAAVYCDEHGNLTCRSAVCTHMGGIVSWNAAEKTWDCPCHGARFHTDGRVMSGPAERPLPPLKEEGVTPELVSVEPDNNVTGKPAY